MIKSVKVPDLIIIDHLINHPESSSNAPSPTSTPTSARNQPPTTAHLNRFCSSTQEESNKIPHKRIVPDIIPNMFLSQEQPRSPRNDEESESDASSFHEAVISPIVSEQEQGNSCHREPTSTFQGPPLILKTNEGKVNLSPWSLPLGRPLAAAPSLLLIQAGTAISTDDAIRSKKRRRSRGCERRNRTKVACRNPQTSNLVAVSSSDEKEDIAIEQAAVTLSEISTKHHVNSERYAGKALPPPPFQLISDRLMAGRLPYPMAF